ncbi:MAG TPA: DNA repair protein RadA [Prolixibacteraceae bacterium]|nr:DNA repair protein RadA [Prolixibacteraceae bacterium]HRV87867.1 DNA repair protein RadA [Prolixibacteraceae bacterium]
MNKLKTVYTCQNCGAESPKWIGRCPSCDQWNTYVEEIVASTSKSASPSLTSAGSPPLRLSEIADLHLDRLDTGIAEFNRVLGGGLVPGSLVLIGGEPGIGKSTLVLQLALSLKGKKILYASGEESLQQIKLRANRLKMESKGSWFLAETSLEMVMHTVEQEKPDILVVDSIQTMATDKIESSPGSVAQVRECTAVLLRHAKKYHMTVILIGHINKEGNLAGPKVLEHIVDTVIQFEGDNRHYFRVLRSTKNRFGSTAELGIFEMRQNGLVEVPNPSDHLLSGDGDPVSGTAIAATIEGVRPFLLEIQSLVSSAAYGMPQRSSTGFDLRRLNMLLAVLEKRAGFKLTSRDVFLNVAGGLRITDPATDLAVLVAILSSSLDLSVDHHTCFTGEAGLTGEVRAVSRIEQRIAEAARLGFRRMFIPRYNKGFDTSAYPLEIIRVARVEEVFRKLFGNK